MEASMRLSVFFALLSVFALVGCTQKDSSQATSESNAPHAAILTRDGTTVTGTVRSSTPSQITLNMDAGGTRTILTKDIKSVEYGEPAIGTKTATAPINEPGTAAKATPRETRNESDTSARFETRHHPDK